MLKRVRADYSPHTTERATSVVTFNRVSSTNARDNNTPPSAFVVVFLFFFLPLSSFLRRGITARARVVHINPTYPADDPFTTPLFQRPRG